MCCGDEAGTCWVLHVEHLDHVGAIAAVRGEIALAGGLVTLALVLVTVAWGTRTFQRENA